MNQELKQEWTTALRSGDYKQGREALRCDNAYCCLGVLGDLLTKKPGFFLRWLGERLLYESGFAKGSFLPDGVAERVGIFYWDQKKLATMNDEGQSFAEIADYIDLHIPTTTPL